MQVDEKNTLEDVLSDGFDKMVAEDEKQETEISSGEEVEVQTETSEEVAETHETNEVESETHEPTEIEAEAEAEPEPEYDEPAPERWTQEMKETYKDLPPNAKKMMVEKIFKPMQRQYTENTTQLAQMKEQIAPVMKVMEEYGSAFKDVGADPVDAIRRQAAWAAHFVKVGAEQGMADMAKSYGVKDLGGGQVQESQEYLTPTERNLKAQLDSVQNRLNQREQTEQQRSQQYQEEANQRRYRQIQSELASFADEQKDGKPLHPYVDKVAPQIAGILKGGLVKRVDDYGQPVPYRDQFAQAYKMAVDLDPSLRSAVPTNRQRQVERAKAAQNVGVVTTMSSQKADVRPNLSVTDAVSQAFDQLSRRSG